MCFRRLTPHGASRQLRSENPSPDRKAKQEAVRQQPGGEMDGAMNIYPAVHARQPRHQAKKLDREPEGVNCRQYFASQRSLQRADGVGQPPVGDCAQTLLGSECGQVGLSCGI